MKRIFLLWAFAFGFLPLARSQPNGVTSELRLPRTEYLSDEDMPLKVRIENRSGQDISLGKDDNWITFSVTGEKDALAVQLVDNPPFARDISLHSGQEGTVTFNLTPYFDFRAPGRYTVKATFKIPQWHQEVACRPVSFTVINGMRLPNLPDMTVGVPLPEGVTNTAPEVRKYFLEKVTFASGMKLYFQLTDATGVKTLRSFPLGTMTSFSDPDAQIDRFSNLHVLNQTGGQAFLYTVINPRGQILDRQTYEYTTTRPELRGDANGGIVVVGGMRRLSATDIPPGIQPASASIPSVDGPNE